MAKYNMRNSGGTLEVRAKAIETNLQKFGVEDYAKTQDFKDRMSILYKSGDF